MKVQPVDIANAVAQMSMCKFFPSSDIAQQAIMCLLEQMVSTREQLAWITSAMVNKVGEWQGPAELRGVFCTRFKPADGIEANCSIPGFRAADFEARAIYELDEQKKRPPAHALSGLGSLKRLR